MSDALLWLVVALLLLLGLIGTLAPFLPGTPVIFLGALVHAFATGWTPIGPGRLAILAALAVLAYALHYAAGALGVRRAGGSAWAVVGAVAGAMVGVFFGIPGLFFGPMLGAIAGELLRSGELVTSIRTGVAALIGMLLGAVANFTIAVTMIALFLWWVARGGASTAAGPVPP
jgi:uncharacterized protein YqgC (DUF456 family)